MKQHLIKMGKNKAVKSRKNYEEYTKGAIEEKEANPDCLAESDGMYMQTDPDLSDSVRRLVETAKRGFTPMQFHIFSLLTGLDGREPLTIRETALKMGLSPSMVQRSWETIRTTLQMWSVSDSPNE